MRLYRVVKNGLYSTGSTAPEWDEHGRHWETPHAVAVHVRRVLRQPWGQEEYGDAQIEVGVMVADTLIPVADMEQWYEELGGEAHERF